MEKIVEIVGPQRYLSKNRGFLEIHHDGELVGRVDFDQIQGLVITGHGCTHSSNLLVTLAERNIPVCICNNRYVPSCWILPITANGYQSQRMRAQCQSRKPKNNNLWKQIVRTKIKNQAGVLEACGEAPAPMLRMAEQVSSGDKSNLEAQAAKYYWKRLLGSSFKRDKMAGDVNTLLNYSYTIIRSCIARAIVGAGLHPTIGIHHRGPTNTMCLVDDLIEPFRPIADLAVKQLTENQIQEINAETKQKLAALTSIDLPTPEGNSTMFQVASRMATSLAQIYLGKERKLSLPELPPALFLSNLFANSPGAGESADYG